MLGEDPFILTSADSCAPISRVVKVFFFPRRDGDQAPIVQNLKSALAQTLKTIPLLAGSVKAIAHEHQLGRLAITAPWTTADEILTVKDLTKTDFLDYETLRSMHFPMVHVDYGVLLTLPDPGGPRPVLMAQINFIKGGLILGTVIDHGFTDGNGFVSVLKVWAAYCRGDDGARTIAMDSLDRTRLMEGRGAATIDEFPGYTYVGGSDNSPKTPRLHPKTFPLYQRLARMFRNSESWLTKYLRFPINLGRGTVEELLRLTRVGKQALGWTKDVNPLTHEMFFFPRTKLNELKELAGKAETNPKSDDTEWISTNDALASLLWCCITTAVKREKLLHKRLLNKEVAAEVKRWLTMVPAISNTTPSEPVSTLGFLMNARRLMRPPVSQDYIGNVVLLGGIAAPVSKIDSTLESVCELAKFLRRRLRLYDESYIMRLIAAMNAIPDFSKVVKNRGPLPYLTVVVNSWAGQGFYDIDWGTILGGHCERIRVCPSQIEDFCLVFPRLEKDRGYEGGDGLEVEICVKKEVMEALRKDQLFNRFAVWRCH